MLPNVWAGSYDLPMACSTNWATSAYHDRNHNSEIIIDYLSDIFNHFAYKDCTFARPTGFEPAISVVTGQRFNQLSYGRICIYRSKIFFFLSKKSPCDMATLSLYIKSYNFKEFRMLYRRRAWVFFSLHITPEKPNAESRLDRTSKNGIEQDEKIVWIATDWVGRSLRWWPTQTHPSPSKYPRTKSGKNRFGTFGTARLCVLRSRIPSILRSSHISLLPICKR